MQKSFVMLKPECIKNNLVDEVIRIIEENGFIIENKIEVNVNEETILKHYEEVIEKFGSEFKKKVIDHFKDEKVIKMIICKDGDNIIKEFRTLVGATEPIAAHPLSIRGKFSNDSYDLANKENRILRNIIHASDSEQSARKEIDIWFND